MQVGDFLGSYKVLQEIGRGGMATVYRARQGSIDRDVAIKVIQRGSSDPEAVQRFQREARLIARLEHPHILPVYDFDGAHDPPYIVMRCLDGGTLEDVLARGLPPPAEAAAIMRQVCAGLAYAHRQGVIHRDIKPSNILFDRDGNAFVSDFGIARLVTAPASMRITQKGMVLGSVEYMSPEQAIGKADLDHRSDLYSLGVLLFQLLTGRLPYVSDPPLGVLSMHIQSPIPSAVLFNPNLPAPVDEVICKVMAKDREQRYRSALELSAALDEALGGGAVLGGAASSAMLSQTSYLRELVSIPAGLEEPAPTTAQPSEHNRPVTALYLNAAEYVEMVEASASETENAHRQILNLWLSFESILAEAGGEVLQRSDNDLLAVWGAGPAQEGPDGQCAEELAVQTALALQAELRRRAPSDLGETLNLQEWQEQMPLNIGIHSGMALFSPLTQSEARTGTYAVSGATISLAYRLMQTAFGSILVTQDVYRCVRGVFEVQPDLPLRMRGRSEGLPTFRVTAAKPRAFRPAARGAEWLETRMVGREAELKRLQHAFLNAIEDAETQVVTITGEAGLGKSRLLDAIDQWTELRPEMFFLFRGRATGTPERPYSLLRDMITFRFQIRGDDPPGAVADKLEQGIARLLNGLTPAGEIEPTAQVEMAHRIGSLVGLNLQESPHIRPLAGDPAHLAAQSRAAFVQLISILASADTVFIQLEDLHLADDSSLDLLEELFDALYASSDSTHLIVTCTTRPELYQRRPGWGRGMPYHTRLDLQPLDRRESRELVRELLQKVGQVPHDLRDLLVENAGGNPFYLEELVKMLIDDRVIVVESDSAWRIETSRLGALSIPHSLTGLLETRLDTLLAPEKLTLQRAAVFGRVFYESLLAHMDEAEVSAHGTGAHVADLPAVLSALAQREFIHRHETSAFAGNAEYSFVQALLREAVYTQVSEPQRSIDHRAAAEWLSGLTRADELQTPIADHYERAGALGLAARALHRAGERAAQRGLFREAEELYERALARLPGGGAALAPDPERLAVLLGLGAAAEGRGNLPRAEQALVEALETAARLGEPASLASARYLLGLVETRRGSYTIAREHFDLALPQARQSGDDAVLANVLSGLAEASFRGGDIDNAFLAALECIDLARAQGNDTLLAAVQNRLATVYWMHGETVAAREQFDEALALARRIGLRRVEGAVLANLGMLASTERKWSEAVSCWTAGLGIHRELSEISGINITACNLAVGYIRLGDLEKALPLIQESLQAALGMQSTSGRLRAVLGWGEYQLAQGHTRQGFTLLGLTRWHPSSAADNVVAVNLGTDYWMERLRLTRSQVAALLEEGKKLDLDAVVKEISQS